MSIRTSSALVTVAATLGLAAPASAAPILFARPGNRLAEVVPVDGVVALGDSSDPNLLYVLPPSQGGTELTNVFLNANTGFCQEMTFLQSSSLSLAELMDRRADELEDLEPERLRLNAELAALRVDAASKLEPEVEDIREMRYEIEDLTDALDLLRDRLLDCETQACEDDLQADIDETKALRTQRRADLRALERTHRDALQAFERAEALVEAKQDTLDDLELRRLEISAAILQAKDQFWTMYRQYASLEGGFGGIEFSTGWDASVAALRAANAGKGFVIQPIDTREVRVFPQLVPGFGADGYLSGLPAVMAFTLNGRQIAIDDIEQHLSSFPGSMSSAVRLSLVGACPMKNPTQWQLPQGPGGLPLFSLHADYSYPVAYRTNVTVTLNVWKIYEYMKRVSSRNGFFRSKSSIYVDETTDEETRWTFDFFDESGLTEGEKRVIVEQIKAEIMASILQEMGVPSTNQPQGTLDPMPPVQNGAVVFANALDACGWYTPYCTGAAWLLRGLHATFGGATSEVRYQQKYDRTIVREYRTDAVQYHPASTTFTK